MRLIPIVPALTLLILVGCDSESLVGDTTEGDTIEVDETVIDTVPDSDTGGADSLLTQFSGATFVALGLDQAAVDSPSDVGSVSFTNDTVTWTRSETVLIDSFVRSQSSIVEVGSYVNDGSDELVASFPDRDILFSSDSCLLYTSDAADE